MLDELAFADVDCRAGENTGPSPASNGPRGGVVGNADSAPASARFFSDMGAGVGEVGGSARSRNGTGLGVGFCFQGEAVICGERNTVSSCEVLGCAHCILRLSRWGALSGTVERYDEGDF